MKKWYLSKTMILAIAQAISGLLVAVGTEYPEAGGILLAKSAVDVVLRVLTTKGVK